jgi:hypothetical protein
MKCEIIKSAHRTPERIGSPVVALAKTGELDVTPSGIVAVINKPDGGRAAKPTGAAFSGN